MVKMVVMVTINKVMVAMHKVTQITVLVMMVLIQIPIPVLVLILLLKILLKIVFVKME
jgi:hypothetical protein